MRHTRRSFLATSAAAWAISAQGNLFAQAEPKKKNVPWLDEIQKAPDPLPPNMPQLSPLLVDDKGQPITTREGWEKKRQTLRQAWLDFLGPLPAERKPPKLEVLEEDTPDGVIRQLVRYETEPGLLVEGYLLRPKPTAQLALQMPGVVVLHSTVDYTIRQPAGLEGPPEKFFGLKLAQRGCVTFCPRCFLWQGAGDYKKKVADFQQRHSKSKGMAKMLIDAMRGVDVLLTLKEVDPKRIGAVGHSLGAKEALYLAAFDERVAVTVSSEGGIGIDFSNWDAPWYLSDAVKRDDFRLSHHEVLALVAPRPFLLIGGQSADNDRGWAYIQAVLPVYQLYFHQPVGQFNHRQGHAVPPIAEQRIYEWFSTYL